MNAQLRKCMVCVGWRILEVPCEILPLGSRDSGGIPGTPTHTSHQQNKKTFHPLPLKKLRSDRLKQLANPHARSTHTTSHQCTMPSYHMPAIWHDAGPLLISRCLVLHGQGGVGGIGWGDSWPPAERCSAAGVAAKEKGGRGHCTPLPFCPSRNRLFAVATGCL